jgi:hypothetical protein
MTRTFTDSKAVRTQTPLMIGMVGPSGGGKTYSALRLATGIQRVAGGRIGFIDTEAKRGLFYSSEFDFDHLHFEKPFGSLDYLDAILHFVSKGIVKTIIIDTMSGEHEGPGGMLEQHAAKTKELAAKWKVSEHAAAMSAWAEPKAARRKMINEILQMQTNFIFCYRAREKLKIVKGQEPVNRGFMPIAGEEFVYEMLVSFLLLPGSNGCPTYSSDYQDEQNMIKVPGAFMDILKPKVQLSEDIGQALAEWSMGRPAKSSVDPLLTAFAKHSVTEADLSAFIGHSYAEATEEDRVKLRGIGKTMAEKKITFQEAIKL